MRAAAHSASGGLCGLCALAVLLSTAACSGELDALDLPEFSRCPDTPSPEATHRQYAVTSYLLPNQPSDFSEDIDGDGKPDNRFAEYIVWGGKPSAFPTLGEGSLQDLINRQLQTKRRGVLLIDVWANELRRGCVKVRLQLARSPEALPPLQPDRWHVAHGSPKAELRGYGSHQGFETIPFSRMRAADAQVLDLFLPLEVTAHHFRLHGARMVFARQSDGRAYGALRGVIPESDLEEAIWPVWAREFTELIHRNAEKISTGTGEVLDKVRGYILALEGTAPGLAKCLNAAEDCCLLSLSSCYIQPTQLQAVYMTTIYSDISAFDRNGEWHLRPAGDSPDSTSAALGFSADPASFSSACTSGSFCATDGPEPDASYVGGWAQRGSDVWIATQSQLVWHFDGLEFSPLSYALQAHGESAFYGTALWGTASDDIWIASARNSVDQPLYLRRWNGGKWTLSTQTPRSGLGLTALHGTDQGDGWAILSSQTPLQSQLLHYDGASWQTDSTWPGWSLNSLWMAPDGTGWAGGQNGNLLHRRGQWAKSDAKSMMGVLGHNIRAIVGTASDNVWAFTGETDSPVGRCWHYDGKTWRSARDRGCDAEDHGYLTAWIDGHGVVWAAGESGLLRRYDPKTDSQFVDVKNDADGADIHALFGARADGSIWAIAGDDRQILMRYQP